MVSEWGSALEERTEGDQVAGGACAEGEEAASHLERTMSWSEDVQTPGTLLLTYRIKPKQETKKARVESLGKYQSCMVR